MPSLAIRPRCDPPRRHANRVRRGPDFFNQFPGRTTSFSVMIRVELRPSHRLRRLLIAALAGASVGMGLIALLPAGEGPLPFFRDLHATLSGKPQPVRQESAPVMAPVPVAPERPRGTTACLRILRLGNRLSPPLRMTSLAADAGGGYNLEGSCRADQVESLQSILDTLKGLPAEASLSYWRDRDAGENQYRFAFRGRLSGFGGIPLPPVTAAEGGAAVRAGRGAGAGGRTARRQCRRGGGAAAR